MDMSKEIVEMISAGDLDNCLTLIASAVEARQDAIYGRDHPAVLFRRGDIVKVIGHLKPNYLFGHMFTVTKVNTKTCEVKIPDGPEYRRFAGQKIRIPKTALEVV